MQDHKQMQALLVTYDELDGPTRQQVDDHLATCPACAATLAAYQQSDHLLRAWLTQKEMSLREQPSWSSVTPPMWVQRTRPRQRAAWRDHWAFRLSRLRPPLSPVAWAGLLLLLLGLLLFSFSGWLPIAEPVRAATPTVVTATAEAPAIQTTPVVTGEKTTIRFAVHRWGEANFLQLIREFEAANPDLAIELVIIERLLGKQNESDWAASDFTQAAPSVDVLAGYPSLADLHAGLVRDLMPFFTADASLAVTDFYSGTLAANQWQGGLWALPSTMHVNLIYYDKAAFDEAGISYPKPGWTWHEFVEIAKALTSYDRDTVTRWGFVESLYTPLTTMSKDDFYAGRLSLFTQSGQVWGLPAAAQPKGTGYNTQLFDEAGVDYPTRAWTTADFLRLTQLLTHGDGAAKQCRQPVGRGCAFFPSSRRRVMAFPPAVRSCSQPRTANR